MEKNINFVAREDNSTSLPQARPIENVFGTLDQLVYKDDWEAKTVKQLKTRVEFCLRKLDDDLVQGTLDTVRKLLRECVDKGPFGN